MSGRGGRSRGGLGIAAAAVPPAAKPPPPTAASKQSLPPSNIFAAATRVSGRSPARGAPPRGGGSAAGPPAPRGRGTLRGGGPGVAVTRGGSLGRTSPPVGGRGGSPLGARIGGSGGGLRSSPKPPPPTAASLRGKPALSIISAVGVSKGGVKVEALADKVVTGIAALSTTTADHLTVKSVIGAAADRLDLKLCDFPETPPPPPTTAEEGAVSSSLETENDLSSSAVGDETHAAKTMATTPSRRRRVFPKLNDNPEAPEVVDVENMKSSSMSAGGQHSLATTAKRAAQRPEAVAAVVVSADSLVVGAGDEPVKNGGGGPWVKDKGEINGLPAAAASTTNGYDVVEATAVEGEEEKERLQASPVKVVKAEVKTEVEAMVQVR
jgi:hypothetical protein